MALWSGILAFIMLACLNTFRLKHYSFLRHHDKYERDPLLETLETPLPLLSSLPIQKRKEERSPRLPPNTGSLTSEAHMELFDVKVANDSIQIRDTAHHDSVNYFSKENNSGSHFTLQRDPTDSKKQTSSTNSDDGAKATRCKFPNAQSPYIDMIWSSAFLGPFKSLAEVLNGGISKPLQQKALISAAGVSDISATFVADPFVIRKSSKWYIYSQIMNNECQKGEIGLHMSQEADGLSAFNYLGIVVREDWHLAFPFVVEYQNNFYMTTCALGLHHKNVIYLYEALSPEGPWRRRKNAFQLPRSGQPVGSIFNPVIFHDVNDKEFTETWYLFFYDEGLRKERVYVSDHLLGMWQEHPESGKYSIKHSGGVQVDDSGTKWCFERSSSSSVVTKVQIAQLSRLHYIHGRSSSVTLPYLAGDEAAHSWGEQGMHTLNVLKEGELWYMVVDGWWNDKRKTIFSCLSDAHSNQECHSKAGHLGHWSIDTQHRAIQTMPNPKSFISQQSSQKSNFTPDHSSGKGNKDIRVLILTMKRPDSFERLIKSLVSANYLQSEKVHVDIWIDKPSTFSRDMQHKKTIQIAFQYQKRWSMGKFNVHIREESAGLTNQWLDAWELSVLKSRNRTLSSITDELAVILEDDLEVSPFFSTWLQKCHSAYDGRPDFAGCTLQRASLCAAKICERDLNGGPKEASTNFFYPLIGTWGFSPSVEHWSRFTKWARSFINSGSKPYVDSLKPSEWFRTFERQGRCPGKSCMWSILHIKYVSEHSDKMTCYSRVPNGKTLASSHREQGLHYPKALGRDHDIMTSQAEEVFLFPRKPSVLGWDGQIIDNYDHKSVEDWYVVKRALAMSSDPRHTATTRGYISLIIVNEAFLSIAKSWLCNTEFMKGVWQSTLFIATSHKVARELGSWDSNGRHPNVVTWNVLSEMNVEMEYGDVSYFRLMLRRLSLYLLLAQTGVNFLITEADSVWSTNVLASLTQRGISHLPSIMPGIDEHTHMMGFCLVTSLKPGVIDMYKTLKSKFKRKLEKYKSLKAHAHIGDAGNEQHLFTEFLTQKESTNNGFTFQTMPKDLYVSGIWYKSKNRRKCPRPFAIQNNWIIGNAAKIERAKRFGHWYLSRDGTKCVKNTVNEVLESFDRHLGSGC